MESGKHNYHKRGGGDNEREERERNRRKKYKGQENISNRPKHMVKILNDK